MIQIENLTKCYGKDKGVVDLSLRIELRETFAAFAGIGLVLYAGGIFIFSQKRLASITP